MFRFLLIFAALGLFGFRQDSPLAGTRSFTLSNGLTVLCREQREAPLVAIDLWIRAGSLYEGAGENGAAHFLEHMMFKGTETRGPGEIDAAFEDIGSELNAGTTRDGVHFHATIAANYLAQSLDVLSDAVQRSSLASEQIIRERAVILDEGARRSNDWRRAASDALYKAVFGDSAAGRPILGTPESLGGLDRQRLAGFYSRYFRPERAALVMVGSVSPETAYKAAEAAFGNWPRGAAVNDPPPSALAMEGTEATQPPADGRKIAAVAIPLPAAMTAQDERTAAIVLALLGDGRNGHIVEALRKRDISAEVDAEYARSRAGGMLLLFARSKTLSGPEVDRQIQSQLDRAAADGFTEGEVEWARRRLMGAYLFDTETYAGQARLLGQEEVLGSHKIAVDYMDTILSITAARVNQFARDRLGKDRRVRYVNNTP